MRGSSRPAGCRSLQTLTIPATVYAIEAEAFFGCASLTGLTIPGSVSEIGDQAFRWCTGLTEVTLGEGLTVIGEGAFLDCYSLERVTVPASVTQIGRDAFSLLDEETGACEPIPGLRLTVPGGSYAAQYCKDNGLTYTDADVPDWLTD
jgi:hypothetical protein